MLRHDFVSLSLSYWSCRFFEYGGNGEFSQSRLERQTMRCSIYERRPWVCRELEMGGGCVDARQAFNPAPK